MENISSYEKINYSLRPAKNIERKMLCEAFCRLSTIHKIEKYQYIGFGSTYFSDFNLIHRTLGINNLISIEKDVNNQERFEFNKPFSCIDIKFGLSNDVLPTLNWSKFSIVWVDYDSKISDGLLEDINTIVFNIKPGSVFLITVDVKPDHNKDELLKPEVIQSLRVNELKKRVNPLKLPSEIEKINLDYVENPKMIYKIISDQINEILVKRNGGYNKNKKLSYKQLFHFIYDDGTLMLTLGGVIFSPSQQKLIDTINFNDLDFIREEDEPFNIDIPQLTFKEITALDALLPENINFNTGKVIASKAKNKSIPKLKSNDVKKFSKIYRYFPNFAEASF
jgi:hypothetical protein